MNSPNGFSRISPVQRQITNRNQNSTIPHQQAYAAHAPITRDDAALPDRLIQSGLQEFRLNTIRIYDTKTKNFSAFIVLVQSIDVSEQKDYSCYILCYLI
jgi:hypothetical protein